jgi:hypothetical protein
MILLVVGVYALGKEGSIYSIEASEFLIDAGLSLEFLLTVLVGFYMVLVVVSILGLLNISLITSIPVYLKVFFSLVVTPIAGIPYFFILFRFATMESLFRDCVSLGPLVRIKRHWSFEERMEYASICLESSKLDIEAAHKVLGINDKYYVYDLASQGETMQEVRSACNNYVISLREEWTKLYEASLIKPSFLSWINNGVIKLANILTQTTQDITQFAAAHPYIASLALIGTVAFIGFGLSTLDYSARLHIAEAQITELQGNVVSTRNSVIALRELANIMEMHPDLLQHLYAIVQPQQMAALAALKRAATTVNGNNSPGSTE